MSSGFYGENISYAVGLYQLYDDKYLRTRVFTDDEVIEALYG